VVPQRQTLVLLVAAGALLLSGCADDAPEAPPGSQVVEAAPEPVTTAAELPFGLQVALGSPVSNLYVSPLSQRSFSVDVPRNATLLAVDGEWTCASGPACELAVVLFDPSGEFAAAHETLGPAHVEVAEPDAGDWTVAVFASAQGSLVVDAKGLLQVAVTHPAPVGNAA
jgi:hypothetical protein